MEGLRPEDSALKNWGWCRLDAVTTCANNLLELGGCGPSLIDSPFEIFERYGLLCNKSGPEALLTWASNTCHYVHDGDELPEYLTDPVIYIPAGWAERIIKFVRAFRVLKVTTFPFVEHEREVEAPKRRAGGWPYIPTNKYFQGPFVRHQLVAHRCGGDKAFINLGDEPCSSTVEISSIIFFND